MENDQYLKITNAVYSLLDLFPDGEPLKNKTKEKSLAVLDNLIASGFLAGPEKEKTAAEAIDDIQILLSYLNLGNLRGFLSKINLIIVSEQYHKIIQDLKPIADALRQEQAVAVTIQESAFAKATADEGRKWNKISELLPVTSIAGKKEAPLKSAPSIVLAGANKRPKEKNNSRQEQIIKILGEKGKVQVADLKQIMPDVSKRTLRRDMDDLLKRQKVDRIGEWNQTFYQIRIS